MKPYRQECSEEEWLKSSQEVLEYAKHICKEHNGYHSSHEALGVMMEEFQEFIETLHWNDVDSSVEEAIQLAAGFLVYVALFQKGE